MLRPLMIPPLKRHAGCDYHKVIRFYLFLSFNPRTSREMLRFFVYYKN